MREANGTEQRTRGKSLAPRCCKHPGPWHSFQRKERRMNATESPAPRQRKPRPKPARHVSLRIAPEGKAPGIVRITVGRETMDYFVSRVPSDFGTGFLLEKIDVDNPASYHVNLDGDKKTCDCKGHARWSRCKHADGLAALVAAGRL